MNAISILFRLALFILVIFGVEYYSFEAVETVLRNYGEGLDQMGRLVLWAIPILVILTILLFALTRGRVRDSRAFVYWRAFLISIYICKLCLLPFLVLDDLWRLFSYIVNGNPYPNRSFLLVAFGLAISGTILGMLVYGMLRNPFRYKIFRSDIPLPGLPENLQGLRIVQISDLHSGNFHSAEPLKKAVEIINSLKPDLVFFTGDLVNSVASEVEEFLEVLREIRPIHGTFSILGNHDYGDYVLWPEERMKEKNFLNLVESHEKMGWQLLRNSNRIVSINGDNLAIIGVENYSAKPHFKKYGDLAAAVSGVEHIRPKLLLSHDPSHWDAEIREKYSDIDVTFSGHTHGFQFGLEIPGIFKWSPFQYFYRQWAGLYRNENQFLYVNRGLGFLAYPGRVGMLPEISLLILHRAGN